MAGDSYQVAVDDAVPVWALLFEVAELTPSTEWVLAGGLMVHLHAIRAGVEAPRPTADVDAGVDVRASSFAQIASRLIQRGFQPHIPDRGPIHRLVRVRDGNKRDIVDLMVPSTAPNARYAQRPVLTAPGVAQAIARRDEYTIVGRDNRTVTIGVPDALGAIAAKAAAYTVDTRDRDRHLGDIAVLLAANTRRSLGSEEVTKRDARRLRRALSHLEDPVSLHWLALDERDRARGHATMAALVELLNG